MGGLPTNKIGCVISPFARSLPHDVIVAVTTERYSHLTPEHKKLAVEMLPEWGAVKGSGNILVTT